MEDSKSKKTFVLGAMLLGIAGVMVKVLGLFFRIPLTNLIGVEAMAYYQIAYPVYVMILTVSTSGLPTAISKMISERRAAGHYYEAYRVFRVSFKVMLALGVITSVGVFIFAPMITKLQKEPDAVYALRATTPALLLCPLLSCYRGFFQGQKNNAPTAVSQVIEQIFRVGFGIAMAVLLLKIDLPHAAAGASSGASIGSLFGLIAILFLFMQNKEKMHAEIKESGRKPMQSTRGIIRDLLAIAVPTTIGACIMPILNWIDTLIVKRRLLSIGFADSVARTLYGELTAMASPIVNVPQYLTQAIAISLVPVISDAYRRDDMDFVRKNANLGLRYGFTLVLPCSLGMMVLAKPIMQLFYPTQTASIPNAAVCLRIYAVGLVFLSMTHAFTGVLQGIGKQNIPVINLLIGAVVKTVMTFILTGIKVINVRGAAVGTACAYLVSAWLNYKAVKRHTYAKFDIKTVFVRPAISAAIMAVVVFFGYRLLHAHMGNALSTIISVFVGVIAYALLIFLTGAITAEELEAVPRLRKAARVLKKLHLLK